MVLLVWALLSNSSATNCCPHNKQLQDIQRIQKQLLKHIGPKSVPPKDLAPVIYKLARKYNVNQKLITQIVILESHGEATAYNKRSHDCGIAQLNERTIKLYNKSVAQMCNAKNWRSNLDLGVKILASTHRACAYNQGPKIKNKELCESYERKLASL